MLNTILTNLKLLLTGSNYELVAFEAGPPVRITYQVLSREFTLLNQAVQRDGVWYCPMTRRPLTGDLPCLLNRWAMEGKVQTWLSR